MSGALIDAEELAVQHLQIRVLLAHIFMAQADVATGITADDGIGLGYDVLGKRTMILMPGVQNHGAGLPTALRQLYIKIEHGVESFRR